ncbi:MAG: hypothetical protein EA374_01230, partial [Acholeplasmatales bacterium]
MENYLNALRDALRKQKIPTLEIEDIIADHREMIEEALAKGLNTEGIESMFGHPDVLATSLSAHVKTAERSQKTDSETPSNQNYRVSFTPQAPFAINVRVTADSLQLIESEDADIHITASGDWREQGYTVGFEDDTLTLTAPKTGQGLFGLFLSGRSRRHHFTIALPKTRCTVCSIETVSGDVTVHETVLEDVRLKTVSGDLAGQRVQTDTLTMHTVSGDILTGHIEAAEASLSSVSGDVAAKDVTIANTLSIETVSGDGSIDTGEATTLKVRTVSGDFKVN